MDYFREFDIKPTKCILCLECNCEPMCGNICKQCINNYVKEYDAIYNRVKKYYDNPTKYTNTFMLDEKNKANVEITLLKKKYKLM